MTQTRQKHWGRQTLTTESGGWTVEFAWYVVHPITARKSLQSMTCGHCDERPRGWKHLSRSATTRQPLWASSRRPPEAPLPVPTGDPLDDSPSAQNLSKGQRCRIDGRTVQGLSDDDFPMCRIALHHGLGGEPRRGAEWPPTTMTMKMTHSEKSNQRQRPGLTGMSEGVKPHEKRICYVCTPCSTGTGDS